MNACEIRARCAVAPRASRRAWTGANASEYFAPNGFPLRIFELNSILDLSIQTLIQSLKIAAALPRIDVQRVIYRLAIRGGIGLRIDEERIVLDKWICHR